MTATEQQVRMAAQLYEMRDTARRLLGDRYAARMAELGACLTEMASRSNTSVLQAATQACTRNRLQGVDVLLVMAAAVELTEPTTKP